MRLVVKASSQWSGIKFTSGFTGGKDKDVLTLIG